MLAVTRHAILALAPSLNGWLSASSRRSAISSGPTCQRQLLGDHDELVPTEAPQRIAAADHAVESRGDRLQQFVAGAVTERVVDRLEVVEVDEQRRDRRLLASRAREHLLDTIQDQRPVGQARQRVVRRQERKFFICLLALGLEGLAHPHEAELEAQLNYAQRLIERLR